MLNDVLFQYILQASKLSILFAENLELQARLRNTDNSIITCK